MTAPGLPRSHRLLIGRRRQAFVAVGLAALLAVGVCLPAVAQVSSAANHPAPHFSDDGIQLTDFGGHDEAAFGIAVQSDGIIA